MRVVFRTANRTGSVLRDEIASDRQAIDVNFSVFNLINSSAPVSISYLSGTFGRITDILAPRVARIGVEYSF